jgi:stalled ribosome alternative rescue factor ArfA
MKKIKIIRLRMKDTAIKRSKIFASKKGKGSYKRNNDIKNTI